MSGYEKEWRADPARSGGGELIDQGVHLIDLSRWFLGDFSTRGRFRRRRTSGTCRSTTMASCCSAPRTGKAASLHVSCTEWKNLFSLEIYGRTGKIAIDGLGGSYGVERLAFYKMLPGDGAARTPRSRVSGRGPILGDRMGGVHG